MQGEKKDLGCTPEWSQDRNKGLNVSLQSSFPTPPTTLMNESGWLGCEDGGFSLLSEVRSSMSSESKMIDIA